MPAVKHCWPCAPTVQVTAHCFCLRQFPLRRENSTIIGQTRCSPTLQGELPLDAVPDGAFATAPPSTARSHSAWDYGSSNSSASASSTRGLADLRRSIFCVFQTSTCV